jgi:hypothetical protein
MLEESRSAGSWGTRPVSPFTLCILGRVLVDLDDLARAAALEVARGRPARAVTLRAAA